MELFALLQITITEIHPTPAAGEPEWIECTVLSAHTETVELNNLLICDNRTCVAVQSLRVQEGQFIIFTRDEESLREARNLGENVLVVECNMPSLNNSKDRVELRGNDSTLIDMVEYSVSPAGRGLSIERHGTDSNGRITYSSVWSASVAFDSATCGRLNSHIEHERDVGVTGFYISDSVLHVGVMNYGRRDLEMQTVQIEIGGRAFTRNTPGLAAKGYWSTAITLNDLMLTDQLRNEAMTIEVLTEDMRLENNRYQSTVTIPPRAGSIVITEVLAEPRDNDCDFVEIYNGTQDTVDISGWIIEDTGGEQTRVVGRVAVPPSTYIACASDTSIIRMCNGSAWTIVRPSLNIHGQLDTIMLRTQQGFPVAIACYNASWHSSALSTVYGRSLERRTEHGIDQSSSAWGSSTAGQGSTPGSANSIGLIVTRSQKQLWVSPSPFSTDPSSERYPCVISWELEIEQGIARMCIVDLEGNVVAELLNGAYIGKRGSVTWDGSVTQTGSKLGIGIYMIILQCVDASTAEVVNLTCPAVIGR